MGPMSVRLVLCSGISHAPGPSMSGGSACALIRTLSTRCRSQVMYARQHERQAMKDALEVRP